MLSTAPCHDGGVTRRVAGPLTRVSTVRLVIAIIVIGLLVLAFTNLLGPFRGVFRVIVVLGVAAIVLSYLVEWWQKRRR